MCGWSKKERERRIDGREGSVFQVLDTVTHCSSGPLNLPCGAAKFGKTWSACGQRAIEYTRWRLNK